MHTAREHDLLPWFVNGSLSAGERAAFEKHLEGCARCRSDREWLETMREAMERHGADFLEPHPSVEDLVAVLTPEVASEALDPQKGLAVRRHLALCRTCAEEGGWIRGERAATAPRAHARSRIQARVGYWAAAVLLIAVLAALPFWLRRYVRPSEAEVARIVLISPTRRQAPDPTRVPVPPGIQSLVLLFPVDLGREDFPASLELTTATGRLVSRKDGIAAEDLYQNNYLALQVSTDALPDGGYVARLRAGTSAPIEYPFRVVR